MNPNRWWMLGLLAAAALAFSAGRWTATPTAGGDPLRDVATIRLEWLGLSSAQAAEIATFEPAYQKSIASGCDRQCASRCQLVHLLTTDAWDADQARAQVEAMCAAHRENELATLGYLEQVRRVLTPEQRSRLLERVGECLCESCARNGNLCCVPKGDTP